MSSLFRFAQSAIQGASDGGGGYSHPAQHRHEPDLDAFADLDGDSDSDRGDDDGYTPASITAASPREAHTNATASSSSAAAAVTQQHAPAFQSSGAIPGGYDFEPQVERPRPTPPAGASARSSMSLGRSPSNGALSRSRRASLSSQRFREEMAGRYEATGGADEDQQPAAFAVWRGLVNRLRGTPGGGGGGGANGGTGTANGEEGHGLLFSQDDSEDPSDGDWPLGRAGDARDRNQYPPARDPHLPLPPRAPQFAPPPDALSGGGDADAAAGTSSASQPRVVGRGQGHDGVFANLAAKPDNPNGLDIVGEGPDKEEILPPYEAAQHDPSPAYWETTVVAPSGPLGPDDILVDGMPVGNVFSFAWNLLVSMSFQFVGFLLTFILHTTHAAKNGSRAGLGITLIQLGFYLKQRTDGLSAAPGDETGLNGALGPSESEQRWWWGPSDQPTGTLPDGSTPTATLAGGVFGSLPTQVHGALAGMLASSDGSSAQPSGFPTLQGDGASLEEVQRMGEAANEWMAFVLVTIGSFLLIGSCLAYWRAIRWARAVRAGQGPGNDAESVVAI